MLPPPMISDWARKLIASEVGNDTTAAQTDLATLRVYERLRQQFRAPVGVDAFQALASRALSLTKSQFPTLSGVNVTANGGLRGPAELDPLPNLGADGEVGIILIAQMLRLFLNLLGEAATVSLIEDAPPGANATREAEATGTNVSTVGANYLGPFNDIMYEADQLRQVSEHLEMLTDIHSGVDELMSVAGNIRSIATALDVFTIVRSKGGGSPDSVLLPPGSGYIH